MISDTLSDAWYQIRSYLDDDDFYNDFELRNYIEKVTAEMDAIRAVLDLPPGLEEK